MELRHLRYFVAVAEELHFGRAAARVGIAQPPLSQQIQRLEEELGVKLLQRTQRNVRLTPAGRAFLQHARQTLIQAEQAAAVARSVGQGIGGRLAVGLVSAANYNLLPPTLRRFRRDFPSVEVELREMTTQEQLAALREMRIQVGFMRAPVESERLQRECLLHEPVVVALPAEHRLARQRAVSISALAEEPFVLFPRSYALNYFDQIVGLCRAAGFSPRIAQEVMQLPTIVGLVGAGFGISLLPESLTKLRFPGVEYRPLQEAEARVTMLLAWLRELHDPGLQPVLDGFVKAARETAASYGRESGAGDGPGNLGAAPNGGEARRHRSSQRSCL